MEKTENKQEKANNKCGFETGILRDDNNKFKKKD